VEPGERGEQAVLGGRRGGGGRAGAPRLQVRLNRQAQSTWTPCRRWSGRWAQIAPSLATPGSNPAEEERHNIMLYKRSDSEKRGTGRPLAVKASHGLREQLFRGRRPERQRPVR